MKDLTASLSNQLAGRFVRPAYLVKLKYNAVQYYRWCTGENSIDWEGDPGFPYTSQGMDIKNLGWDLNSTGKITLTVQNLDNVIGQTLLGNDIAGMPIDVWMIYLYDKNVLFSSAVHASNSTSFSVAGAIPKDIPSTGTIYISSTQSFTYSAINGRTFTCSALPRAIAAGEPVYISRSGSYNVEDAIQVFDGIVDDAEVTEKSCIINCVPGSFLTQYTPRRRIIKDNGFNVLPQTGLKIQWGNELFVLEKADY
jgi:hypothetical protein